MDFKGKVVLVTGAAGSVGQAVAAAFQARGAKLMLVDIDAEALVQAYGAGKAVSTPAYLVSVNLLDSEQLARDLLASAQIDVLCNVAGGFTMGTAVHETDDETWLKMMNLNALTILSSARVVVPRMIERGRGWIVNVSAGAALRGGADMGAYAAAKSAVLRLTESMSAELRDHGIHVNCVLPSIVDTVPNRRDMPDADHGRWVSPAALAEVVVFLCSSGAEAIHGACIPVSGLS